MRVPFVVHPLFVSWPRVPFQRKTCDFSELEVIERDGWTGGCGGSEGRILKVGMANLS